MKNHEIMNILQACSDKIESERFVSEAYKREIERLSEENDMLRKRIAELEKNNG